MNKIKVHLLPFDTLFTAVLWIEYGICGNDVGLLSADVCIVHSVAVNMEHVDMM
jgi:hypothetical protein